MCVHTYERKINLFKPIAVCHGNTMLASVPSTAK